MKLLQGLILFLILCFGNALQAQTMENPSSLGSSAKMIGIGNIEGFDHSAAAVFENPAALHKIKEFSFSGFQSSLMDQAFFSNAAMAAKTDFGIFALGFSQTIVGDIPETTKDSNNDVAESGNMYGYRHVHSRLGYTPNVRGPFQFGAALNHYYNELASIQGTGMGIDAGVLYQVDPNFNLSLQGKNLIVLKNMRYSSGTQEHLPKGLVIGGQYKWGITNLYAQVSRFESRPELLKAFGFRFKPEDTPAYISAGFREFDALDKIHTNTSIGLGLELGFLNIFFAYDKSEYVEQDNKYYVSLSFFE